MNEQTIIDVVIPAYRPGAEFRELLKRLDEKDRQLLTLRYFKNLTQAKTAALLSMTQVQVSRREKKLLTLLRSQLLE